MGKKASKTAVGAFVVGAVVLAVAGTLIFGSGALFNDREACVMYFEGDLKGLNIGAPVAFRGVRVGQVTDISVLVAADATKFQIPVEAEIDTRHFQRGNNASAHSDRDYLKSLVQKGLRAQLALQSIVTGQLLIQLDIYPDAPLALKGPEDALEIPTIPSGFERLTRALEEIPFQVVVRNFNQAMTQFGEMLEGKQIETFLGRFQAAADALATLAQHLDQEAIPMVRSVRQAAESVDIFVRHSDQEIGPVLDEARSALAAVRDAVTRAERTLESLDTMAAGYGERSAFRYEVSQTLRDIAAAANSLQSLAELLQQQPEALIRGKGTTEGP